MRSRQFYLATAPILGAFFLSAWLGPTTPGPGAGAAAAARVAPNDNRRPAGSLRRGVLTVRLVARTGLWQPEGATGPQLTVSAFAEMGRNLQTPGPVLRAPVGTEIRVTVLNSLSKPLWIYGMGTTRGFAADSVNIPIGETREFRFRAAEIGTFYYAGRTESGPVFGRIGDDSQLNGVIVVDPPGERPRDRIFVITNRFVIPDSTTVSGLGPDPILAINGRSWPHTERLDATQGDSLHWRVVNLTVLEHPMHLHGFYFRVDATGDGARDSIYAAADRRLAVTELLLQGRTMRMTWSPDRGGNWIFHCHFTGHIATWAALESDRRMPAAADAEAHAAHTAGAPVHNMAGLVMGIRVRPRGRVAVSTQPPRSIRLLVRSRASVYGDYAGYAYVLGGSSDEANPDAMPVPGPTLELARGQPVAINIVNTAHEPVAIHWHGIELESFPDGVPGWSGYGRNTLPMIRPRDSLTVRFTPPRAGTFMYHSHSNENQQISSGLYGALIVTDPAVRRDTDTDRILLFSDGGPTINFLRPPPPTLLNGRAVQDTMNLRAGTPYRLRLINIRTDYILTVGVFDGETPVEWRIVAKDGADLPAHQVRSQPARLAHIAPGEIVDIELTPRSPGALSLRHGVVGFPGDPAVVPIRVQ